MATSDEVRRTALDLAERNEDTEASVRELLACCGDHRVSVVRARQTLAEGDEGGAHSQRAMELLDLVLDQGSWA